MRAAGQGALQVHAGPVARAILREQGLRPEMVRMVPAAAGGPKGLVLNALDRLLFGRWLTDGPQPVHLLGASIGAWRMACACLPDADAALAELAEGYISVEYPHQPGRRPSAAAVSQAFSERVQAQLGIRAAQVLAHPSRRLQVFTSRGRHVLAREGRWRTPLGYAGAFMANTWSRPALGGWLERVVFGDERSALPLPLDDFRSQQVALTPENLAPAILASCSIPFVLKAVHDLPGAPAGAYWDGGITDYHLSLRYNALDSGLVLYPHFQNHLVPGWLDKPWRSRHRAGPGLDRVVLVSPSPEWVAGLPGGKLPDRSDFARFGDDHAARQRAWRVALAEGLRLADEFAELTRDGRPVQALLLR